MRKPKITATVTKEDSGYSIFSSVGNHSIASEGETFTELKSNFMEAVNLAFYENDFSFQLEEIMFSFDLQSFFSFYKVINAKVLSERIGMNQSLLAQYIKGKKTPSSKQTNRILEGVHQIGKELSEVEFSV